MIGGLLKGAAWVKAPKKMFAVKNPKKAAVIKAVDWATDRAGHPKRWRKRKPSKTATALKGLGAAAVAVPLGLWVGKKLWGRSEDQPWGTTQASAGGYGGSASTMQGQAAGPGTPGQPTGTSPGI